MREFLVEGSPNGTVVMGEYVQAETEEAARLAWRAEHSGWQIEKVLEVQVGCNHLGHKRPT